MGARGSKIEDVMVTSIEKHSLELVTPTLIFSNTGNSISPWHSFTVKTLHSVTDSVHFLKMQVGRSPRDRTDNIINSKYL